MNGGIETRKNKYLPIASMLVIAILIIPAIIPISSGLSIKIGRRPTIKVAFIWQKWDLLDLPAKTGMKIYKRILRKTELKYDVKFKVYEFWDSWRGGDVQNGKLRKLGIDVVVGPGGIGGWHCPKKYRTEIKEFVRRGGGFYGICGDSTFGSLGVVNLPRGYKIPLKRVTGYKEFTPMLGLANVYSDASAFDHILEYPLWFKKADMVKVVGKLPTSRVAIRIEPSNIPIQKPYYRDRVRVMLGNVPLVDGPLIYRLFMPKVTTIAVFKGTDDPYDMSIRGEKAIIATTYWRGRVVLSVVHPELTIGNRKAHDLFARNLLWTAKELPNT